MNNFVIVAISYLWQNTMTNTWGLTAVQTTFSFLITTGVGGLLGGQVVGPKLFDVDVGGCETKVGVIGCLKWVNRFALLASLFGTAFAILLMGKATVVFTHPSAVAGFDWYCLAFHILVFIIFILLNATQSIQATINMKAVSPEMKLVATGATLSLQHLLGYNLRPVIPSVFAQYIGELVAKYQPDVVGHNREAVAFTMGMAFTGLLAWLVLVFAGLSLRASQSAPLADTDGTTVPPDSDTDDDTVTSRSLTLI